MKSNLLSKLSIEEMRQDTKTWSQRRKDQVDGFIKYNSTHGMTRSEAIRDAYSEMVHYLTKEQLEEE